MSTPLDPAIQAVIDQAVARAVAEKTAEYEQKITDLQTTIINLQSSQIVPSPVTEHAGGVGTEIAATWSQYDQELARAGLHPSQAAA